MGFRTHDPLTRLTLCSLFTPFADFVYIGIDTLQVIWVMYGKHQRFGDVFDTPRTWVFPPPCFVVTGARFFGIETPSSTLALLSGEMADRLKVR